jgi:hypothetical protein
MWRERGSGAHRQEGCSPVRVTVGRSFAALFCRRCILNQLCLKHSFQSLFLPLVMTPLRHADCSDRRYCRCYQEGSSCRKQPCSTLVSIRKRAWSTGLGSGPETVVSLAPFPLSEPCYPYPDSHTGQQVPGCARDRGRPEWAREPGALPTGPAHPCFSPGL